MAWQPDYITGTQLADYVKVASADSYVAGLATAASRAIDGATHRQFGQMDAPTELVYEACDAVYLEKRRRWLVRTEDFDTTAGMTVTIDGTAVDAGDDGYQLWPRNAAVLGQVYTGLTFCDRPSGDVAATVQWGWSAVPAAVVTAAYMQGNRWHIRRVSPYGVAGAVQDGSQTSLTARLDPDVRSVLAHAGLIRLERPR